MIDFHIGMRLAQALLPGLLAAVVTAVLAPLAIRISLRLRAVDVPGGRKRHQTPTPTLGGIAIVSGIAVALGPSFVILAGRSSRDLSLDEIALFGLATLIIFILGLIDDVVDLKPLIKLAVQILAAAIVVSAGWQFDTLRLPLEGRLYLGAVIAPLLSIAWIVGVTNAFNLIDGLDGLASGIAAIIATSLLLLAVLQQALPVVLVTSCIAGASLGFLYHNWRPAKIYMGDSGSLTLGFLLAAICLRLSVKASAVVALAVPLLALGLPVIDMLLVMAYRFLRGRTLLNRFAGMFHGDRTHLHHLLLEANHQRSRVLWILFGLASTFCAMALLAAVSGSVWLAVGFLIVEFGVVLVVRLAGLSAAAERLAAERRQQEMGVLSPAGAAPGGRLELGGGPLGPGAPPATKVEPPAETVRPRPNSQPPVGVAPKR